MALRALTLFLRKHASRRSAAQAVVEVAIGISVATGAAEAVSEVGQGASNLLDSVGSALEVVTPPAAAPVDVPAGAP
jgi:hypothetical protein